MHKKLLLVLGLLLCTATIILPQTATLKTYGVDPREAEANPNDLFNRPYNGLSNVGIQTQMYLEGQLTGAAITSPSWTVVQAPAGSNASFGNYQDMDDSTRVIIFKPDLDGFYILQFSQGNAVAQLKIHASTYWTFYGVPSCGAAVACHQTIATQWEQTGHYKIFEEGLNGELGSHYSAACLPCHTTGYDTTASNGGFDDFPFVFPDTLFPGQYDSLVAEYPDAMKRGRIQCEDCHGPASDHLVHFDTSVVAVSLNFENCAFCHDEGSHHYFPDQWKITKHALLPHSETRAGCYCHNGQLFVEFIKNGKQPPTVDATGKVPISCAVCHDPHSVANPHQVRAMSVTLENGVQINNVGTGALCMNCHHSRHDAVSYTNNYLANLRYYGPDMGPQADMLAGTNAITFGQNIPTSPHMYATANACATCHMFSVPPDSAGNITHVGGHTFSMTYPDGTDNVAACQPCHGNFGPEFSDKKYYVNGNADLDGDGVANGLQIEIQGLLDTLANHLPPLDSLAVNVDSSYTLTQAQAAYDYIMVNSDRSLGVHNPAYTYGILKAALGALGVVLAVNPKNNNAPHDFALSQNYPNPFNPTTKINFSLPKNAHVTLDVYNIEGQLVKQLINGEMSLGVHTIEFNASSLASGIYLYRIITPEYTMTKKMILLK